MLKEDSCCSQRYKGAVKRREFLTVFIQLPVRQKLERAIDSNFYLPLKINKRQSCAFLNKKKILLHTLKLISDENF